jgi:isoleucyl-tRNA synthetase
LDAYDTVAAIESLRSFVNDFSTWYIRRSRDRVGPSAPDQNDKEAFYETCYEVLINVCKLMAPIAPFITEEIYRNLTDEESVHLADWPVLNQELRIKNKGLIEQMKQVRKIVELGLAARKEQQLKVKQPLAKITVSINEDMSKVTDELTKLIKDELNIKAVSYISTKETETTIELDTKLTEELIAEGKVREIVRSIQEERKKLGTTLDEQVAVSLENWPTEFESYIKQQALVKVLSKGEFGVKRL